jgi:hypothetical protein
MLSKRISCWKPLLVWSSNGLHTVGFMILLLSNDKLGQLLKIVYIKKAAVQLAYEVLIPRQLENQLSNKN